MADSLRIQFVNANVVKDAPVAIDREKREIQNAWAEDAQFFDAPAARLRDLADALRDHQPEIVHFIGHGNQFNELMLLGQDDRPYGADKEAIKALFGMHRGVIRLVILNACYSTRQAELIYEHVESVIGVNKNIGDDIALQYAINLHRLLHKRVDVKAAHEEAIVLLSEKRPSPDLCPQLWTRARGAKPIIITPGLRDLRDKRKEKYDSDVSSFGVSVDCFTLTKVCDSAGGSVLQYEISGLRVTDASSISKVYFQLDTTAGLVREPEKDSRADDLGIYWDPVPTPKATTFQQVIDATRCTRGYFCFPQKLNRNTGPYTFGWSVTVYNMDALSKWDFDNLYVRKEDRLHVDGTPLNPPREYMARLVWVPTARLVIRVSLPPTLPEPRFRCFELATRKEIDREQIVSKDGVLLSMPTGGFDAKESGLHWEPRPKVESLEKGCLTHETVGKQRVSEAVIDFPTLAAWYALDWTVNDLKLHGLFLRFQTEAEAVRRCLVEHRKACVKKKTVRKSVEIIGALRGLHMKLRKRFPEGGDSETFETSLFSFDVKTRRLVMCEGFVNEDSPVPETAWDVELPFGMGLVGTCFRLGSGILAYAKGDRTDSEQTETYLRIPGQPEHEYLMAIPIDHPELTRELTANQNFQRCRQLIGVLAVGSTYIASGLREFCVFPPEGVPEYEPWQLAAQTLRDDCQRECDALSLLLLNREGSGTRTAVAGNHL